MKWLHPERDSELELSLEDVFILPGRCLVFSTIYYLTFALLLLLFSGSSLHSTWGFKWLLNWIFTLTSYEGFPSSELFVMA